MNNKTNNKLTKKDYISKYIFLKILFGEFQIGDLVYSESVMSNLFKTTNATVRVAYNNLIQRGILKAKKGKGYIVLKNIGSYMFDHYDNLNKLINKKNNDNFVFYNKNEKIVELHFESIFIEDKSNIHTLLDIFKIVFSRLEIDEIILEKKYKYKSDLLINTYDYKWNDQTVLFIELKSDLKNISLFDYKKHLTLN